MLLGMQGFNFAQISPQFCPNFALIIPKKFLLGDAAASSAFPAPKAVVIFNFLDDF